jgi:hypothetical protein
MRQDSIIKELNALPITMSQITNGGIAITVRGLETLI